MKKQAISAIALVGLGMSVTQAFADVSEVPESAERPAHRMGSGTVGEAGGKTARDAKKTSRVPTNINAALDAKLASYKNDADRKTWLGAAFDKVETMESKAKKAGTKALLQEFKALLQEKIDALEDDISDDGAESVEAIFQ